MADLNRKYKAFTLVELMAVVAIIGIITAAGFVSLQSGKNSAALQTAQRQVASEIKLAQSYALQGKTQGGATPCGYGFRFTDSAHYEIFYNPGTDCDTLNNGSDASYLHYKSGVSASAESGSLGNGVVLKDVSGSAFTSAATEIYFTVPRGDMYDSSGTGFASKLFDFSDGSGTKSITINPGGSVSEN